jgi:MFS family permease
MDSWNAPFLTFWLGIPLALFIALMLEEPKINGNHGITGYFRKASEYIFSAKSLFVFSVGLLVFILLYGGILTYLVLYMDERFEMTPFTIGIYIAVASIGSGLIAPLSSRFERLIGGRLMLVSGFLAFAVSFFLITVITTQVWLLAVFLLIGAGMGITLPLVQSVVTGIAPTEYRGIMVSFFAMTIRGGQTVGPPVLALLLINGGLVDIFKACFVVSAGFAAILFVWGGFFSKNQNTQMPEPSFEV